MESNGQEVKVAKPYKVVVGYDFSVQADTALEQAVRSIAGRTPPVELHVVFAANSQSAQKQRSLEESQEELAFVVRKSIEGLPNDMTIYAHARAESPAKAILALAAEVEADAIFVGTHNRRGLARLVLGSVAEQVMRLAGCTVTVVRERSYIADEEIALIEPPCPACVAKRKETNGERWWCDKHSKPYHPPHRYSYRNDAIITRKAGSIY